MKSLRFGLFALLLCFATVAVSAPAIAQVQSLEDLMAEVDEDIAEAPDAGTPEPVDEAPAIEAPADEGLAPARPALDTASGPDLPPFFVPGLVGLLILLLLLGQPLYVVIGSLTMYLLFFGGIFNEFRLLTSVIEQTRGLADQAVLLAIPFFVISGALMTEGDIARRLIAFAQSVFGWLPGGLAISAVFACVFFAAISGSSPVTVIAIGSIMYPALIKRDRHAVGSGGRQRRSLAQLGDLGRPGNALQIAVDEFGFGRAADLAAGHDMQQQPAQPGGAAPARCGGASSPNAHIRSRL